MSDVLSCAQLDDQHVELLPARIVLTVFTGACASQATPGEGGTQNVHQVREGNGSGSVNNSGADGGTQNVHQVRHGDGHGSVNNNCDPRGNGAGGHFGPAR